MNFQGKNVLITGINGFLGTRFAKMFLEEGAHVIGIVRDMNRKSQRKILEKCSIVSGDIRDKELVQYALSKYEAQYVIHLAAQPIVRICNNDPYSAYMTTVVGTLNLVESIRIMKNRPDKVIVITSDKAYGPHTKLPYTEDSGLVVADTYCTSKSCEDMVAMSYAITYNLPITIVRVGNLYGPGDLNISRLVPGSIIRLLSGVSPMLYTSVGEFIREFVFVDDAVNAFKVLFEKGVSGEAYNIGGTPPMKILDVITKIRDMINPDLKINLVDKDFYEIKEQYLCSDKLQALGWQPKVFIDEGLSKSIEWYKEYVATTGLKLTI